ncbi:MAG TPA: bacterioferritin-associated ferredoxin [Woeseiaceae bacterium]|nr:bacterioferritin-associated ferredoxin [Woeseiaceae bacterium]
MYVCICNAVTEGQIRAAARSGTTDLWSLQTELGVAAGCGTCRDVASAILREYRHDRHGHVSPRTAVHADPVRYFPATG